jgi:anti-sigma B factor antagonist
MPQFEVTTSVAGYRAVVALRGECDLAAREALTAALWSAAERTDTVLVDLVDLQFMDSSGVHALIAGHHAALERGGRLYVVNAAGEVARLLDVTGVSELLRPPPD